jgi:type VI protein secretion system component VasF
MAKIEELTELLVTEINNFEKSIQKLEMLSEKINATKIGIDITEYKSIIESHQQKMASQTQTIERFEEDFENQLKQAKIYPNWAVIVFIMSVLVSMLSLFFALY